MKTLILYLVRWQLSSPVLALVVWLMMGWPLWMGVVVANLVGGLMFFYVDKKILCEVK